MCLKSPFTGLEVFMFELKQMSMFMDRFDSIILMNILALKRVFTDSFDRIV